MFYSKYLPISAAMVFDNAGMPYEPTSVIQDGVFNLDLYKSYSPLFMPITFVLSYGVSFASFTAVVVHTYRECFVIYFLFSGIKSRYSLVSS